MAKTIADYQADWLKASEKNDTKAMDAAHAGAEAIRAQQGYSGGEDGSQVIVTNQDLYNDYILSQQPKKEETKTQQQTDTTSQVEALRAQIEDWNNQQIANLNSQIEALKEQQSQQIDYSTQQTVADLERQYEDSINTYNQERAKNAYSANQAKDNMALYNAKTGDKGGIGSKLYSDQQASYDAQLMNIDLQQAQLKTDIDRQVADAKAQGDYAKAQSILELGIQKMQALNDQANNYLNTSLSMASNIDSYNLNKKSQDQTYFYNLLNMGIFDEKAALELGVPADQAKDYADNINKMNQIDTRLAQAQLDATLKEINNSGSTKTYQSLYPTLYLAGIKTEGDAQKYLLDSGYKSDDAKDLASKYIQWYDDSAYSGERSKINNQLLGIDNLDLSKIANTHGDSWVLVSGLGRLAYEELFRKVESGEVIETLNSDGTYSYKVNQ